MVEKKDSLHHDKLNSEGEGGGGCSIILIRQMFWFTGRWTYNCCGL